MFTKKHKIPQFGTIYAIHGGVHVGHFFICVGYDKKSGTCRFLSSPTLTNQNVPLKDFKEGITANLIRVVTRAKPALVELSIKQYNYNIEHPEKHNTIVDHEEFDLGLE